MTVIFSSREEDEDINEEQVGSEPVNADDSVNEPDIEVPFPAPCRSTRANAGVHTNPYNVPKSACNNSVSFSSEVLSQV